MLPSWQKNLLHWTKLLLNGLLLQPAAKQLKTASLRIFKQKFIVVNWCSRCNRHFFSHVNNRNEIAQVLNYSRGTWNSGTHVIKLDGSCRRATTSVSWTYSQISKCTKLSWQKHLGGSWVRLSIWSEQIPVFFII